MRLRLGKRVDLDRKLYIERLIYAMTDFHNFPTPLSFGDELINGVKAALGRVAANRFPIMTRLGNMHAAVVYLRMKGGTDAVEAR